MDNAAEDNPNEVIESSQSSQTPVLRSKVRERRINYSISPRTKSEGRKPPRNHKRVQDRKTVSQCLQEVWKKPRRGRPSLSATATKPSSQAEPEEYIKFGTQQSALLPAGKGGIEPCPSVSLFAQQDHLLAKYITNEEAEARVEAELQNLLAGFRAEYEKQSASMNGSPSVRPCKKQVAEVAAATPELLDIIPSTRVDEAPMELGKDLPGAGEPLRFNLSGFHTFSEHSLMATFSEEIARLDSIAENGDRNLGMKVPTISTLLADVPEVREELPLHIEPDEAPAPAASCLHHSPQLDPVDMDLEPPDPSVEYRIANQVSQSKYEPVKALPAPIPPQFHCENALDLRMRSSGVASDPPARHAPPTVDCSVQVNFPLQKRNVGVQHRPSGSFDFTDRNLIVLGQAVEADPELLYQRMRRIAKTSNEPYRRECDLASLFTRDDPYYANLHHFL
uniref:Uncharacterized protein n=1 Tax=Anopheles farauti TaxID=69004 RepID=A0A182Q8F7_9DIPT